jgi:Carboxypeptidase regulatory-like domain
VALIHRARILADYEQYHSSSLSTTISGHITEACSGLPIANASVQIGYLSTVTGANGFYSISNLPQNMYTMIASAPNYGSVTNVVTTSASTKNATDNFSLTRLYGLDYFGVGVNWAPVTSSPNIPLRGDIDATNLYNALQSNLSVNQYDIVPLDASRGSINNLNTIESQFSQFAGEVCPNDTIIVYINTHAGYDPPYGVQISLASVF